MLSHVNLNLQELYHTLTRASLRPGALIIIIIIIIIISIISIVIVFTYKIYYIIIIIIIIIIIMTGETCQEPGWQSSG